MDLSTILMFLLFLIIIGIIFALFAFKITGKTVKEDEKYPKGYYQSKGLALGIGLGYIIMFVLLLLIDRMKSFVYLAPTTGILLGLIIGNYLENKHKDELRPLTTEEKRRKKQLKISVLVVLIIGIIAFIYFAF